MEYNYKSLAKVQLENTSSDFNYIIEDSGKIKRLKKGSKESRDIFEVNFSGDSGAESEIPAACDKTFAEIKDAINNGSDILAKHGGSTILQLVFASSVSISFSNSYFDYINNKILYQTCEIFIGDNVECRFAEQIIGDKK